MESSADWNYGNAECTALSLPDAILVVAAANDERSLVDVQMIASNNCKVRDPAFLIALFIMLLQLIVKRIDSKKCVKRLIIVNCYKYLLDPANVSVPMTYG